MLGKRAPGGWGRARRPRRWCRERVDAHLGHPSLVLLDARLALELKRAQHLTCVRDGTACAHFCPSERAKTVRYVGRGRYAPIRCDRQLSGTPETRCEFRREKHVGLSRGFTRVRAAGPALPPRTAMSAALASASARPSGGVASRSPNPRAPGRQTLPSSKTPCFETRKTRRTSNAPPRRLPPTSVPKLKQQLARSRVTPPADEAETRAGATGSNTGSTGRRSHRRS